MLVRMTVLETAGLQWRGGLMQDYLEERHYWAQLACGALMAIAGLTVIVSAGSAETGTTLLILGTVLTGTTTLASELS